MNKQDDHIDALIASCLSGEATAEEIAFLEEWKTRSEDNRRHFQHFQLIFDNASDTVVDESFNTDAAWQKVRKKLRRQGGSVELYPRYEARVLLRLAAALAIFITVAVFIYRFTQSSQPALLHLAAGEVMRADTLTDGSQVFLNRRTTVAYRFDRQDNTVTAELTGEAYFDIKHDDEKLFVVQAGGTFIRDIGTAFNVQAYPDSGTVEVFVEEGEVIFYTKDNAGIALKANTRGVYHKDTQQFSVVDPRPNITSYKSKVFTFNNASLGQVAEKLNDVYETQIEIAEKLKRCHITVSFHDESVEEIAQIIAETLGLSLSKSGNTITLQGDGCSEAGGQ